MANLAKSTSLFEEFKKASAEEWKAKIIKDLKGADFNEKLVWHTYEGINIQPFYTEDDIKNLEYSSVLQHLQPENGWKNREIIKVKEAVAANKLALEAFEKGADAILFDLTSIALADFSFAKLLSGINPNQQAISFKTNEPALLSKHINQNFPALTAFKGSVVFDPLADWMQTETDYKSKLEDLFTIHEQFKAASNFTAITVGGHHFHNAGASVVQEIAFTLNSAVAYVDFLTEKGAKAEEVINNIEFSFSISTNYFFEIAKLRAFKWLWAKIAASYNTKLTSIKLHGQTSEWSKTVADPYVNMLRNTTEAMSAIAGGCSSISILPYDVALTESSDEFSQRISRNVSTILKEESYLDKTADPAAGSYYIEKLTDALVEASWKLFLETEERRGIIKAVESNFVQNRIEEVRNQKAEKLKEGNEVLVGTNKYINKNEVVAQSKKQEQKTQNSAFKLLSPFHAFELI